MDREKAQKSQNQDLAMRLGADRAGREVGGPIEVQREQVSVAPGLCAESGPSERRMEDTLPGVVHLLLGEFFPVAASLNANSGAVIAACGL